MRLPRSDRWVALLAVSLLLLAYSASLAEEKRPPKAQEVRQLLAQEPITLQSWDTWRKRLTDWLGDRSRATDAAFDAARTFIKSQTTDGKSFTSKSLNSDPLAWYLLSSIYLREYHESKDRAALLDKMEFADRRAIELDPKFSRAHRGLATAYLLRGKTAPAETELQEMHRLDPSLSMSAARGTAAALNDQFADAEKHFTLALKEDPSDSYNGISLAASIVQNRSRSGSFAAGIKPIVEQFPQEGTIACFYGLALAFDGDARGCLKEFDRAKALGVDAGEVFAPELVEQIHEAARPSIAEIVGYGLLGFVVVYAVLMLLMAGAGVVLARFTHATQASEYLNPDGGVAAQSGQVIQTGQESWLARLYALSLLFGLVLFYLAIPFVVVGLLAGMLFALYLIFQLGRIPVKLVIMIVVIGLCMIWAVLKSLFTSTGRGGFGVLKTAKDCPRLFNLLHEVAERVETRPVDEVYVAPGSAIGVHQEGRGPFGVFGVKRRVLTLGVSTLRILNLSELKAILTHEYAHFSHRDTFYSRFIYQVSASIEQSMMGMGQAAGKLNYVNPFFWFMFLYYKSYSLLSSGFSRSREFLADRMAASLYGADVFARALRTVAIDGNFFEANAYRHVSGLLGENKAFENIYESFEKLKAAPEASEALQKHEDEVLKETGSLYASHPTLRERFEAVALLPKATAIDSRPAIEAFDDPAAIEKEMTEFLTAYMHHVMQLQAQAAAQAAQATA